MFCYYEHFRQLEDEDISQAMSKILIINRQFLYSFFNKESDKSDQIILAVVNINEQKVEYNTDWNYNGIYTGFLNAATNLAIMSLASPTAIQLCLINFERYTHEVTSFLGNFCRILRGML